ncbi:MAG TPA: hypothetical protein VLB84_07420, partial [Bacteroidia bacterium]|nr:hypothetical protein [Bacteroidia bacterium]
MNYFIQTKKRKFSILLFFITLNTFAQNKGDYRSNALLMDWSTPATWLTWDPSASLWIQATMAPDFTQNTITIQEGHTVVISSTVYADELIVKGQLKITGKLIILDGTGTDLQIEKNGKLLLESNDTSLINCGKLIMHDSIINNYSSFFINKGIVMNDHSYFKNKGKLINDGNSLTLNSGDFLSGGQIIFENKSIYQHHFPSTEPAAGTIPAAKWNIGSVCEIIACGNAFQPGGLNQVFHHFIWNNSTQPHDFNLIANPTTINGNFEIRNTNSKKLSYKGGSPGDLVIADSFKITGGVFILTNGSAASHIQTTNFYQDSGSLDLTGSEANGALSVSSYFTHKGGIIKHSGVSSEASVRISGSAPSVIESAGFRSNDPILFSISKETDSGTCTIPTHQFFILHTGTSFSLTDNKNLSIDLQINGTIESYSNAWNLLNGFTQVNGAFINHSVLPVAANSSPESLALKENSLYQHAADGGEVVTARWDTASVLCITGIEKSLEIKNGGQFFGNIQWNSLNQQVPCKFGEPGFEIAGNFNIDCTGQSYLLFPDCDFTIHRDLLLQHDSRLQLSAAPGLFSPTVRTISLFGNLHILHNALFDVGNPDPGNASDSFNQFRDFRIAIGKDFIQSSSAPSVTYRYKKNKSKKLVYRTQFIFKGNRVQHFSMKPLPPDSVGDQEYSCFNPYSISVSGKGTHLIPQLYDLKVHQLMVDKDDTLTMALNDINIIHYPVLSTEGTIEPASSIIGGTLDMGLNKIKESDADSGSFCLLASGMLKTKDPEGIDSSGSTGCILTRGTRIFNDSASYVYNGITSQVTGSGLPVHLQGSLTICNSTPLSAGGVRLTKPTHLSGQLNLNAGKLLTSSTHPIIIGTNGLVLPEGGSAISFVDGYLIKTGLASGSEFIFPLGNTSKWARLGLTITNSLLTDEFGASYVSADPSLNHHMEMDTGLDHISSKEYWILHHTAATSDVNVSLFWESGYYSGIYSTAPASNSARIATI